MCKVLIEEIEHPCYKLNGTSQLFEHVSFLLCFWQEADFQADDGVIGVFQDNTGDVIKNPKLEVRERLQNPKLLAGGLG